MADKFKFHLLTGTDPQAQYDAISTKEALTIYLLSNGVGYLGDKVLFGKPNVIVKISETLTNPEAGKLYVLDNVTYNTETLTGLYFYDGSALTPFSEELIATYINSILTTDMSAEDYTGDDNTVATTKAIVDLVNSKLSDSNVISTSFFRKVVSHTLTADDLTNSAISLPEGATEGDVGLLFTADTEGDDDGDETYYFISLADYLTSTYTFGNTNSIKMTTGENNQITADLNVAETETSIVIDEKGVSLNKATTIDEESPSADKLITEAVLVDYVQNAVLTAVNEAITEALADVVTYTTDDGTTTTS